MEPPGGFLSTDYGRLAGAKRIARCNTDRRFLDGSSMRRLECMTTGLWNDTLDSCECKLKSELLQKKAKGTLTIFLWFWLVGKKKIKICLHVNFGGKKKIGYGTMVTFSGLFFKLGPCNK